MEAGKVLTAQERIDAINMRRSALAKAEKEAQLKKIAEGLLREKNKKDTTFSFNLKGSFDYVAGARVTLKNFGIFDKGNYIITAVSHKKDSSGYETQVEGRVCLDVS